MADGKPVEAASAAPGEKRSASRHGAPADDPAAPGRPAGKLAKASESGDASVHKALADLQTAQMNAAMHRDAADRAAAQAEGHDEEVARAKDALAEMGYE